jgi:hypothetical protein
VRGQRHGYIRVGSGIEGSRSLNPGPLDLPEYGKFGLASPRNPEFTRVRRSTSSKTSSVAFIISIVTARQYEHTLRNSAILRYPSLGYKDLDEINAPTASQFLHCPFPKIQSGVDSRLG